MTTRDDNDLRRRPRCRSRARTSHARVAGPLTSSALVLAAALTATGVLGLPAGAGVALVVGVALVTAVAYRRTIASLVAGAGIRVAQPYGPGEQIRVFVPSLNTVEDAEIVRVGPANTTLMTASGIVLVPNAYMLRGNAPSR